MNFVNFFVVDTFKQGCQPQFQFSFYFLSYIKISMIFLNIAIFCRIPQIFHKKIKFHQTQIYPTISHQNTPDLWNSTKSGSNAAALIGRFLFTPTVAKGLNLQPIGSNFYCHGRVGKNPYRQRSVLNFV